MLIKFSIWLTHLFPFFKLIASSFAGFMLIFFLNLGIEGAIGVGLLAATMLIAMSGLIAWILINAIASRYGISGLPITDLIVWGAFLVTGVVVALSVIRFFTPILEKIKKKLTLKTSMERKSKIDIRDIDKYLPQGDRPYSVEKYFKKGDFFLGLDERDKPIYLGSGRLPHVHIAGGTGSGKGVFIGMLEAQALINGATVVNFDPKDDEFGPHVMHYAAKKAGVPYYFIDLRPEAPPQINLFRDSSKHEIFSLFESAFSLTEKGSDSDHYRFADREYAEIVAEKAEKGDYTPSELFSEFDALLSEKASGLRSSLREMANLNAVNAKTGLDLHQIISDGAAIYIKGSISNTAVIKMQRMLLVKLIQIAESRDRMSNEKPRQIIAIADEFSYQINSAALAVLKTTRDKGLNLIVAHQSMEDFSNGPKDLDPKTVEGAVMQNGKLKLIYAVDDYNLCCELANKTGAIQVDDETRTVKKNIALAESVNAERTIRQTESQLITPEQFGNLPRGIGVLFRENHLAQFVRTSFIEVEKSHDSYKLHEAEGVSLRDLQDTPDNRFPA